MNAPKFSARRRWASAVVLSASLLVVTMDLTILNVALPELAADLQPTSTQQLWIVDAYSLILAGLLVSASALADRWGRKRMLLAGFVVFAVASTLVLLAESAEMVILIRALLGIGGAMIMPTTLSLMRAVFTDPSERATALGMWAAVSALGAAIGPIVGGFLLEHFSWQAAFLINVPLMVVALVAGLVILPESKVRSPGRWDYAAAGMSIAGMALLIWSIKQFAKQQSLTEPLAWVALIGAVTLITVFVRRCMWRPDPLLDVSLFGRRPFTAGVITALCSMVAMAAFLLLLAQWLQLVEGMSPFRAGIHLLPMAAAGLVSSTLAPVFARRVGARFVLAGGLGIAGGGMLVLAAAPGGLDYGIVAVAMSMVGAGTGSLAIASAMIMAGTPPDKAGNAAAIEETSYDLGNVLGVAVLGSIAALVYRNGFDAGPSMGVDANVLDAAGNSLGSAMELAAGIASPELALRATEAFDQALIDTSLIGGIALVAAALTVFLITPPNLDITKQEH